MPDPSAASDLFEFRLELEIGDGLVPSIEAFGRFFSEHILHDQLVADDLVDVELPAVVPQNPTVAGNVVEIPPQLQVFYTHVCRLIWIGTVTGRIYP